VLKQKKNRREEEVTKFVVVAAGRTRGKETFQGSAMLGVCATLFHTPIEVDCLQVVVASFFGVCSRFYVVYLLEQCLDVISQSRVRGTANTATKTDLIHDQQDTPDPQDHPAPCRT